MGTGREQENYFDGVADTWDENPMIVRLTGLVVGEIASRIPLHDKMKAMEFGCGTGLISMRLAGRVGSISAVDISEKMLGVVEQKVKAGAVSNISTFRSQEREPLPDDAFSLVFSNMAMHHIEDVDAMLQRFYEILSPGGYIAISDLDSEDGSFHGDMEGIHHHGFSREGFLESLEKAGFVGCDIRKVLSFEKEGEGGHSAEYSVFLATGQKA